MEKALATDSRPRKHSASQARNPEENGRSEGRINRESSHQNSTGRQQDDVHPARSLCPNELRS
jgi:hypothetical protein